MRIHIALALAIALATSFVVVPNASANIVDCPVYPGLAGLQHTVQPASDTACDAANDAAGTAGGLVGGCLEPEPEGACGIAVGLVGFVLATVTECANQEHPTCKHVLGLAERCIAGEEPACKNLLGTLEEGVAYAQRCVEGDPSSPWFCHP